MKRIDIYQVSKNMFSQCINKEIFIKNEIPVIILGIINLFRRDAIFCVSVKFWSLQHFASLQIIASLQNFTSLQILRLQIFRLCKYSISANFASLQNFNT